MRVLLTSLVGLAVTGSLHAAVVTPAAQARAAKANEAAHVSVVDKVVPTYVMIGGGSGVVISPDGYMLTNHHVIDAAYSRKKLKMKVRVGSRFHDAEIVGTDPVGDITVLKIKDVQNLPYVEFADSDALSVGQQVIAIGNPFGAMGNSGDPTVTFGIISCLHRFRGGYSDAIQTDAPINPGNSGGPLLTMDGKLAGINGQINSRHGARANTGIGMAIPANQIARFLPKFKTAKGGVVLHGYLRGLEFDTEEADGIRNGAELKNVRKGSSAAALGLKAGDRVVGIQGLPVLNGNRLRGVIGTYPAYSDIELQVERGGETVTVSGKLEALDPGSLGLAFGGPKDRKEAQQLRAKIMKNPRLKAPVIVQGVKEGMPSARSGIQKGDRLVSVNGVPVLNIRILQGIRQRLLAREQFFAGDTVKLRVARGEGDAAKEIDIELVLGSTYQVSQGS